MFNLTIDPQPVSLQLDMSQIESYNEETKELRLFNIESKIVTEDIAGVEFSTTKSYDKKYIFDCSSVSAFLEPLLQDMISGGTESVTISGVVDSNTEATLKATVSAYTSTQSEGGGES